MSTSPLATMLLHEVGISILQLAIQALLAFLVVNRLVERRDERRRRALSGLAEAQLLEAAEGLLADGLPRAAASAAPRLVTVGPRAVAVTVAEPRWDAVANALRRESDIAASRVRTTIDRHRTPFTSAVNVGIIEPSLAPLLVRVDHEVSATRDVLVELSLEPTRSDLEDEATAAAAAMFESSWNLHQSIVKRWT